MQQKQAQSTADRLLKQAAEARQQNELTKKEMSELKRACRGIFSTRNGQYVARAMMKVSGIYRLNKNNTNVFAMGEERGREFMYLFFVKGMLSAEQMNQIETEIEKGE